MLEAWGQIQMQSKGCDNQVVNGGVCIRHGEMVEKYSHDKCTNHDQAWSKESNLQP